MLPEAHGQADIQRPGHPAEHPGDPLRRRRDSERRRPAGDQMRRRGRRALRVLLHRSASSAVRCVAGAPQPPQRSTAHRRCGHTLGVERGRGRRERRRHAARAARVAHGAEARREDVHGAPSFRGRKVRAPGDRDTFRPRPTAVHGKRSVREGVGATHARRGWVRLHQGTDAGGRPDEVAGEGERRGGETTAGVLGHIERRGRLKPF